MGMRGGNDNKEHRRENNKKVDLVESGVRVAKLHPPVSVSDSTFCHSQRASLSHLLFIHSQILNAHNTTHT
ncbi:hypothetical protein VNO77_42342 [Canavalia gladiata]|uniref:Uncharacterized protein n=1 Tax=Canavalia gladiata TaxID=3824 RepID=A0AAN9K2H5_CANGL